MDYRIEELQRLINERYGYEVSHVAEHEVEQPLEDGKIFRDTVHEFTIDRGSRWEKCYGWFASPSHGDGENGWPCECFAVPAFAVITDAQAAVQWVHGLPLREGKERSG